MRITPARFKTGNHAVLDHPTLTLRAQRHRLARGAAVTRALLVATSTCGSSNEATTTDPELAENLGYFDDVTLQWVGDTTSGPQDIQSTATGQKDFGGAFNGAIVKFAAGGAPITSVVGYYGSDRETYTGYFALDDSPIRSARDR